MNFDSCHVFSWKEYTAQDFPKIFWQCMTLCPKPAPGGFVIVFFEAGLRSVEKILGRDRMGLPFSSGPGRARAGRDVHPLGIGPKKLEVMYY